MIDKVFAAGCLIVIAKMSILSQAIAEPVLRAPKEQDFFFDWVCVVVCWNSRVLKLFDAEANLGGRKILSKPSFPTYWLVGFSLYSLGWLENINKIIPEY
jgi:hypothetical protein